MQFFTDFYRFLPDITPPPRSGAARAPSGFLGNSDGSGARLHRLGFQHPAPDRLRSPDQSGGAEQAAGATGVPRAAGGTRGVPRDNGEVALVREYEARALGCAASRREVAFSGVCKTITDKPPDTLGILESTPPRKVLHV